MPSSDEEAAWPLFPVHREMRMARNLQELRAEPRLSAGTEGPLKSSGRSQAAGRACRLKLCLPPGRPEAVAAPGRLKLWLPLAREAGWGYTLLHGLRGRMRRAVGVPCPYG